MFTGIVQEVGVVLEVERAGGGMRIAVGCSMAEDLVVGESVCTSGACLTVEGKGDGIFWAFAMEETLRRTWFSRGMRRGVKVNLERALALGDRLGGHLVTGHVDCVGRLLEVRRVGLSSHMVFGVEEGFTLYLVEKGSVAVDGVSLTVVSVGEDRFSVGVIPHTLSSTTLGLLRAGDPVNLEADLMGKYAVKLLRPYASKGGITLELLREEGFLGG